MIAISTPPPKSKEHGSWENFKDDTFSTSAGRFLDTWYFQWRNGFDRVFSMRMSESSGTEREVLVIKDDDLASL